MKKMLVLEEEKGNMPEEFMEKMVTTSTVLKFKLLFLNNNEKKTVQKVRNLNFQDLMRHLYLGESVFIIPKLLGTPQSMKKQDRTSWYFAHM